MIRWIGEKMGWLEPPDEESARARERALEIAVEAHDEVNRSRNMRGVPSLEYDLLTRGRGPAPKTSHR